VYILTESLFTTSIIAVLYALVKSKNWQDYLLICALCAVPVLLRPNGFIVLLGVLACFVLQNRHLLQHYKRAIIGSAIAGVLLLLLVLDRYLLTTFEIVETYARGEVIYAAKIFSVPADGVVLPTERDSPLLRILYFVLQNPVFFFKLFAAKLLVFLAYAKPYYSAIHNAGIILIIYPLYFFAIRFCFKQTNTAARAFAPTLFILQGCIVAATSEDWDSRFIIPLLPLLMAFGMAGLYQFVTSGIKHTTLQSRAVV